MCTYVQIFLYAARDVHPYKNIPLPCYRVTQKNCQLVAVVPKAHVRTNVCANRKSIKLCNFQKCFGGFLCSCAPMFKFFCMPPDGASTEYQISNREFSAFLRTYYCDFLSNVYRQAGKIFFCCNNGQCDAYPAGIAVPQKRH